MINGTETQAPAATESGNAEPQLRRAIPMPLLVFYGVGVTIGAGIFALVGEIVGIAGDLAPLGFLLAGLIAGATGLSYAQLASVYPRAAGEAVFVRIGLGRHLGTLVGYGVTITAIISSAVISKAFAGYLGTLLPFPSWTLVVAVIVVLGLVAWLGVRESVAFAAIITVLEVGTLIVIAVAGAPLLTDSQLLARAVTLPSDWAGYSIVFSASLIAFFAFIGFEDIENMAEETINPHYALPRAILWTLGITVTIYALIALIAIALPDRASFTGSQAPLAHLFETVTGWSGRPVAAMASIAMVNGILIQIVMASRVIYGMGRERLAPPWLAKLDPKRLTPTRAILLVCVAIAVLALGLPLVNLAKATSLVTLCVFTLVNLALWRIGSQPDAAAILNRWRYWGVVGAVLSMALLLVEAVRVFSGAAGVGH